MGNDFKVYINGEFDGEGYKLSMTDSEVHIDGYEPANPIEPKPILNENQQVVFEWLKSQVEAGYPCFDAVQSLRGFNSVPGKVLNAYMMLNEKEKRQVLAAFAEWGMKSE